MNWKRRKASSSTVTLETYVKPLRSETSLSLRFCEYDTLMASDMFDICTVAHPTLNSDGRIR